MNKTPIVTTTPPEIAPQPVELPSEMDNDTLLDLRERLLNQMDELSAYKAVIDEELVLRIEKNKTNGFMTDFYTVSITTTYTTDKETAKELGAITESKMERINTPMIRELFFKGIEIKNLQISKRPNVKKIESKE